MKQKSIIVLFIAAVLFLTLSSAEIAFADYDEEYDEKYERDYDDDRYDDDEREHEREHEEESECGDDDKYEKERRS